MCHNEGLMHYRFFTTSTKAWQAMLVAIGGARESIYLEMYILEDDTHGFDFLSELAQKAESGVRVCIVLDRIGSFRLANAAILRLRASGAEVLFFSYWWKRTHRKMLIVDERQVFLGGVNISGQFAPWRDLQIELHSERIARTMIASFALVYKDAGGEDPLVRARARRLPLLRRARFWFIDHGIGGKRSVLHTYYTEHINAAKERICLVTPYFIPHRWFITLLHSALLRGVAVDIIVPNATDFWIIDRVNRHFLSEMHALGATCYLSGTMNHAKAMMIDDREGLVGSNNLDALSFDWNIEAGIFFNDKHMTADLVRIMNEWKSEASKYEVSKEARWYDFFIIIFLEMFRLVL